MVKLEELIKIGDKYYLITEVQKALENRTTKINPEDIEDLEA